MGANLLPVPGRTLRRSRRIDRVNQLTQAAKSAANRRENQPAQVDSFEFIVFFSWRKSLVNFDRTQVVHEMSVQIGNRLVRLRTIEWSNEALCHQALRMNRIVDWSVRHHV